MIRRLFLPVFLVMLICVAGPALAQRNGLYDVTGTNPDGSAYEGRLVLNQVGIVSWQVVWEVSGDRIEGIGMSAGNVFSVTYQLGQRTGLGIFNVNADGFMSGQWTVFGSSGIGTESLTPR